MVLFKGVGAVACSLEAVVPLVDSLGNDQTCAASWASNAFGMGRLAKYDPTAYNFTWASPPCQQYSRARGPLPKGRRTLRSPIALLQGTSASSVICSLKAWLMESPPTGLLKSRAVMAGIQRRDVCYCWYSDEVSHCCWKSTRLWGALPFAPRPMCTFKDT